MTSKLLQSAALILSWPFLWLVGLVTLSLVVAGQTVTAICKVWRES